MRTIYKYALSVEEFQYVSMPTDSKILCVHEQNGLPTMWVEVDTESGVTTRTFSVYGTGFNIGNTAREYIGTCFCLEGFVWHVYEDAF